MVARPGPVPIAPRPQMLERSEIRSRLSFLARPLTLTPKRTLVRVFAKLRRIRGWSVQFHTILDRNRPGGLRRGARGDRWRAPRAPLSRLFSPGGGSDAITDFGRSDGPNGGILRFGWSCSAVTRRRALRPVTLQTVPTRTERSALFLIVEKDDGLPSRAAIKELQLQSQQPSANGLRVSHDRSERDALLVVNLSNERVFCRVSLKLVRSTALLPLKPLGELAHLRAERARLAARRLDDRRDHARVPKQRKQSVAKVVFRGYTPAPASPPQSSAIPPTNRLVTLLCCRVEFAPEKDNVVYCMATTGPAGPWHVNTLRPPAVLLSDLVVLFENINAIIGPKLSWLPLYFYQRPSGYFAHSQTCHVAVARDPSLARQEMRANAKPAAASRDGVPGSKIPALIKMSNQHTRLSRARTANPPKLDVQHNTQAMPVRAHHGCRAVP
eukprot:scaffold37860_cov60-Phaeocystis_antarctica.AAC.2